MQLRTAKCAVYAWHCRPKSDLLQLAKPGSLHTSAADTRPLPVAMYIHGGGMTAGDKSDLNPVFLDALASSGYAVASVNYRLAPQSRFPAQIEDVKCAIRYLRAKAPNYGLNASEIFAFGTSVGGQLVALAALTGPHSAFDVGSYPTEPSNLLAVADLFGPANLTERASGVFSLRHSASLRQERSPGPASCQPHTFRCPELATHPSCSGHRRHDSPQVAIHGAL